MHRVPGWSGCLAVSGLRHTCTASRRSHGLSVAAIWNHIGKSVVQPLFSLSRCLFFSGSVFLVFSLPSISSPPLFFLLFFSFHCYHSVTGAWMSLSKGWLITMEAPGHPEHPPSTQLDAVVNNNYKILQDKLSSKIIQQLLLLLISTT